MAKKIRRKMKKVRKILSFSKLKERQIKGVKNKANLCVIVNRADKSRPDQISMPMSIIKNKKDLTSS